MNPDLFVTREAGLFALREGNVHGVVRVKTEDAQGILDYALVMFGVGTILDWRIFSHNVHMETKEEKILCEPLFATSLKGKVLLRVLCVRSPNG